jgi:hypothetical protein
LTQNALKAVDEWVRSGKEARSLVAELERWLDRNAARTLEDAT